MATDIGSGLSEGVNNFIRTYQMAKDRKKQEKLEKIQPVLDAIHGRLKDNTVPLDERKRLADQLESVYKAAGINIKLPQGQSLSEMLLPKQLLDQIQDTGEVQTVDAVNAVPEGASQTENITTTPVQINLTKRRGEMSPVEIGIALQRIAERGRSREDLAEKKDFSLFQFRLNQQIQENAYTKNPEEVVEPTTGRTWSIYTSPNPEKPPIFKPLGAYRTDRGELLTEPQENTISKSTYETQIRAKSGANGKPATLKALIFAASKELQLPEDDPAVEDLAAKRYSAQYQARTDNLQLGTVKGEQTTTGKEPIQPIERERLDIANRQFAAELEGQIDSANATIQTEDAEINSYQTEIDAADAEIKRLLEVEKYYKEDDEVKAAQKRKDDLVKLQNAAKRRKAAAEGIQNRAKKKLQSVSSNNGTSSSNSGYSPTVQKAIEAFRNNPNNKAKGADKMSDEQIYTILQKAGRIR